MNASDSIGKLATALNVAQRAMKGAVKDSSNPFFKSTYADLASVWDAIREPFGANGLSVVQGPGLYQDGAPHLTTRLLHVSGEWLEESFSCPVKQADPQGIGSCLTYMRRYALAAIAGVCPEDDDGEGSMGRARDAQRPEPRREAPKEPSTAKPAPRATQGPVVPFGKQKGKPLAELDDAELAGLKGWCEQKDPVKFAPLIEHCANEQEARRIAAQG